MFTDFVMNGVGHGAVGEVLQGIRFDPGMLRPYIDDKGRRCVTINTGKMRLNHDTGLYEPVRKPVLISALQARGINCPVWNAVTLRRDEWAQIDRAAVQAAQSRMRLWGDIVSRNRVGGFDAMAKMTYEYDAVSDPGEAVVDMEGITDGRTDSPLQKTRSIPLPITHSDWWFSSRRIAGSQSSSVPLSTAMPASAGRRVGEMVEKMAIGVETSPEFGTQSSVHDGLSKAYGITTSPYRILKTDMTVPTGSNADEILEDVIELREAAYSAGFYGPFMLYTTPAYDQWLDRLFVLTGGNVATSTVRQQILAIEGIEEVRRLDFWTGGTYQMALVQMTSDVIEGIDGMPPTMVQWESQGGMRQNFKLLCIQTTLIKGNYDGETGIVHGTTA